jgi:hypothetical protein
LTFAAALSWPRINPVKGITMNDSVVPAEVEENTLLELLDRLLNAGVVLCGDLTISVADIELLYLRLQVTLSTVETARRAGWFVPTVSSCHSQLETQNA